MRSVFTQLLIVAGLLSSLSGYSQDIQFVKDKVLDKYLLSGEGNTLFHPEGVTDSKGNRQGSWKDFFVQEEVVYLPKDSNNYKTVKGNYMLYGEGSFADNVRDGFWKYWLIEDVTFKKYLFKEETYKKGIVVGPFKTYYTNGFTVRTGTYVEGQVHGEMLVYYPYGELDARLNFNKGQLDGKQEYYYRSGKLRGYDHYKNDKRDGEYKLYYQNDSLKESGTFSNDQIHGIYRYYYDNGQLWVEKEFRNGKLWNVTANYRRDGSEQDKGTIKNGTGTAIHYDEDGRVYLVVTWEDGKVVKEQRR